jgi:hypothetical protein
VWKSKPSKLKLNDYHLKNLFSQNWDGRLWTGLKSIDIIGGYNKGEIFFPETLVKISEPWGDNSDIKYNFSVVPKIFYSMVKSHFPNGILLLKLLHSEMIFFTPTIPESVIELRLDYSETPTSTFITPYLKIFVTHYIRKSDNFIIPPNLKEFCILDYEYNEPLPFEIPETLEQIVICNYREISNKIILMTVDEYRIIMDAREKEIYGEDDDTTMDNENSDNDSINLPHSVFGSPYSE